MTRRVARALLAWAAASAIYLLATMAVAMVARGPDLDRLTSRSAIAGVAGAIDGALWTPQSVAVAAIGREAALRPGMTPALIVFNAAVGGLALLALRAVGRRLRGRT